MTTIGLSDQHDSFVSTYNRLRNTDGYRHQLNKLKTNLDLELKIRQPYYEALQQKDTLWWKNEIKSLKEKINTEQDPFKKDRDLRIKGFLGIACYTISKHLVQEHDIKGLPRVLTIYKMLEPENPDMYYFSAFPDYWRGNMKATVSDLIKAKRSGFSDWQQMRLDFPKDITVQVL